jgi:two-component system, NarL family, nitrate/nitrite response regulator NarL
MPTLLCVDDDARLNQVLALLLRRTGLLCRFACSGREALEQLQRESPDVVLVDLGLPDIDGVDLIRQISARWPDLPVLVITIATAPVRILAALRAGAQGYLFKEDLRKRLPAAVTEILAGGSPLSSAAARVVLKSLREQPNAAANSSLTERERAVVDCLSRGLTYEEVGNALDISINTVRTHVRRIYAKLDVSTKIEAALLTDEKSG